MARTKTGKKTSARSRGTRVTARGRAPQPPEDPDDPNDPEDDTSDDNDSLVPSESNASSGGDDGGGDGGGGNGDDDDDDYDFDEGQRSEMVDLFVSLGFSLPAARHVVRDEQIDQVEVLTELTNVRCTNVVKNIRRVPIPGPGPRTKFLTVSDAALDKFQMAVYAAKHGKRTSRALTPLDIDPDFFDNLRAQREIEDKAASDKPVLPTGLTLENDLHVSKTFENVVEHLGRYRGMTGVPLSYVVRGTLHPPDSHSDPPVYDEGSIYRSYDEEMTARAPICLPGAYGCPDTGVHLTATFMSDMTKVWEILHDLFGKQSAWTHVSGLARTRNRRLCYQTLYQHFLGGANSQSLGLRIIEALRTLQYDGKSKNFTFDKFTAKHSDYHGSADKLENFNSLTEEMKCQLFVSGIRDPAFEACKAYVTAQHDMMSNFNAVKTYFTNYARQRAFQNPPPPTRNVSSVGTGGRGAGRGGGRGTDRGRGAGRRDKAYRGTPPTDEELAACSVTVRNYSEEEYAKLTSIQRYKLRLLRNKGTGTTRTSGTRRPASTISSVTNASAVSNDIASEINDMQIDDTTDAPSNRGHPLLARQADAKRSRN